MTTRTSTPARNRQGLLAHRLVRARARQARARSPTKTGKGLRLALELASLAPGSIFVLPNEPRGEATEEGA